jgi:hypothetical protein
MTALIVVLPIIVVVEISLQLHQAFTLIHFKDLDFVFGPAFSFL